MGCNNSKSVRIGNAEGKNVEVFLDTEDQHEDDTPADISDQGAEGKTYGGYSSEFERNLYEKKLNLDTGLLLDLEYTDKPSLSVPQNLLYSEGIDEQQVEHVDIDNKEDQPVFFKVKTTHPALFAVKPNRGQIGSGSSVKVQVTFKPSSNIGAVNLDKVKLMVQGLKLPDRHQFPPQSVWEMAPKESVSVNVIKVYITEPEIEDEVDFSKYKSVTMEVSAERKPWWEKD